MLTAIQPHVRPAMERFGLMELAGQSNVFERTVDAIASVALDGQEPAGVVGVGVGPDGGSLVGQGIASAFIKS